jgi:hypothetical protein
MNDKIIAVTGATGQQGGAVARKLLADGWQVRALTRDTGKPAAQALAELGAQVMPGDMDNREELATAFHGVYGVFSVQNFWLPTVGFDGEIRQGKNVADAPKLPGSSCWSIPPLGRHTGAWARSISKANGSSSSTSTRWVFRMPFCVQPLSWIITIGAARPS